MTEVLKQTTTNPARINYQALFEMADRYLQEEPKNSPLNFEALFEMADRYLAETKPAPAGPVEQPARARVMGRRRALRLIAATAASFTALPFITSPRSVPLRDVPVVSANTEVEVIPEEPVIVKHIEAEVRPLLGFSPEEAKPGTAKKDILREMFLPRVLSEVRQIREKRAREDPDYLKRIDGELNEERINGVLLGIGKEETLTDSILIFSYHIPSNTVFLLSVPRDLQSPEVLRVTNNLQWSRINNALQQGGMDLVKEALENLSGLSMDLTAVSRFDVLEDAIDKTVEYVEVEVKSTIDDKRYPTKEGPGFEHFYLPAGRQRLNGSKALAYSRARLYTGGNDYVRAGHQQEVFAAFFKRLMEESQKSVFSKGHLAFSLRNVLQDKMQKGTLKPDFDLEGIVSPGMTELVRMFSGGILQQFSGGWEFIAPQMQGMVIDNRNFVVGAGIEGAAITMVRGGNARSPNPREHYYKTVRQEVRKSLLGIIQGKEKLEFSQLPEAKIYYPEELSYAEVKPWIGMLRNSHDAVLTESLFLKELAQFPREKRKQVFQELARAHAKAIVEHYGLSHAVIGIDPGHGGTDIGAGATTVEGARLAEKDATWELANLTARELLRESEGKYDIVILRPEIPQDEDIDGDGLVSNIERLQKRKALLLAMAEALRLPQENEERKIAYVSLHFNGETSGAALGAETYFPNDFAMQDNKRRASSEALARLLQVNIVQALRNIGYAVVDRGAKTDPDKRKPASNSNSTDGPYIALGSPKLDRTLA